MAIKHTLYIYASETTKIRVKKQRIYIEFYHTGSSMYSGIASRQIRVIHYANDDFGT